MRDKLGRWRGYARATISAELEKLDVASMTEMEVRARLNAAYPFGERRYFPYKAWLKELAKVMNRLFPEARKLKCSDVMTTPGSLFGGNL